MTSQEFEELYACNSSVTVEELRSWGRVVVRCTCGDEQCLGWASLSKEVADCYINEMPGLYGYRYPKEGE